MPSHSTGKKKTHDPYAALRLVDFRWYLVTNSLVTFGTQMVGTALGWELYEKTGKALDLGLFGLFWALPFICLAPLGGNIADRFDRRVTMVLSTLIYALALVGLALGSYFHDRIGHYNYWVFGVALVAASSNAFYIPAKQAFFNQLVPRSVLPNAVTWSSSTWQAASVLGPTAAGMLITRIPYPVIYGTTVLFEVVFILVLLSLRYGKQTGTKAPLTLQSLTEGARFVWKVKPILATITMDLFAVLLGGCTALLPIFVKDILRTGPETLGWLTAAPSIGAFCMALLVARTPMKRPGVTLLWAVTGFGAATIVFGLSRELWLSWLMMFLIGALDNISVIVRGTLVQVLTPDRLLGRVQALNYIFISSSNDLGRFESGVAAALLGTVPAVVLGGIGAIGIVLWVKWKWPEVAALKPLHRQKPSE